MNDEQTIDLGFIPIFVHVDAETCEVNEHDCEKVAEFIKGEVSRKLNT